MSYKITGLDPLAVGQVADDDELEMIDKSDTSLSASGTNKRVVPPALLATAVPGGTRTVSTLKSYLANNAVFNVKDFGAVGDGATDDTAAVQAALDAVPARGRVVFPDGTYIISGLLTVPTDYVTLTGHAKIKAQDGAQFVTMLTASGRTGVVIEDLEFDANKAGRAAGQTGALSCLNVGATTDCVVRNVTVRNSLGFGGASTVAISASGGAARLRLSGVRCLDCGDSATNLPSDGIFVRGDHCIIENCYARNVTDTAFVLEGCNHSRITNVTADSCTAIAAISNDTAADCVGNAIDGVTGTSDYVGSTGGIVGVACFSTGNLRQITVANVQVRLTTGATNLGPAVQIRTSSTGRVIGCLVSNPSIDAGTVTGVIAQGIQVSDSTDVVIENPFIKLDTGAGAQGIRFDGACENGVVNGGYITGADTGIYAKNTSAVSVLGTVCKAQAAYGIYADDTATIANTFTTITGAGTASTGKAVGATLRTVAATAWAAWTPTYSSDLGNAATTFAATPTTTLARYSRVGNVVTITLNYSGTLNAVTPGIIFLTLPAGVSPSNSDTYSPAVVYNSTGFETGIARVTTDGRVAIYRANAVAYSSGAEVHGRVSLSFEVND